MTAPAYSAADLAAVCWRAADLRFLLHSGQEELRTRFHASTARRYVLCCSRRYGKSLAGVALACEQAVRVPGSQIRVAAPTAKMVKSIIEPHMRRVLADCPRSMRPRHLRQEGVWHWPNGSSIYVAGCDLGNAERLRGTDTHLAVIDEAGFVDDLRYVIDDILLPQTLTVDGRLLLLSSPPRTPDHPFTDVALDAEANGAYMHRTIYDAPHVTDAMRAEYLAESGGETTTTWRREYLAEFCTDEERALVPEFQREEARLVEERQRPDHCDTYTVADLGFQDLTFVTFAHYDFAAAVTYVEDEVVMRRANSAEIADAVHAKERELWGDLAERKRRGLRHTRYLDDSMGIVISDLASIHKLTFARCRKDDLEAQVNALRLAVTRHTLRIHPRCQQLIAHLRHGVWNKSRTKFERTEEHHFDGVAAAMYLVRHTDRQRNPFPPVTAGLRFDQVVGSDLLRESKQAAGDRVAKLERAMDRATTGALERLRRRRSGRAAP